MSAQRVESGCVVVMTFVVAEAGDGGEVLDNAWASRPYAYIQGQGQMPPGFEARMRGRQPGERFEFEVPCEQAYGPHNSQLVQKIDPAQLPPGLEEGMAIEMAVPSRPGAPLVFHVIEVREDRVRLDGNHPMAGEDLRFMGRVRQVRLATAQERASGRVIREPSS